MKSASRPSGPGERISATAVSMEPGSSMREGVRWESVRRSAASSAIREMVVAELEEAEHFVASPVLQVGQVEVQVQQPPELEVDEPGVGRGAFELHDFEADGIIGLAQVEHRAE